MSFVFGLFAIAAAQATQPGAMPTGDEMKFAIMERDSRLFYAAFENCQAEELNDYLLPEFRMIHDQGGMVAESREAFVGSIAEQCAARAPGGANEGYKNRRLITPGTRIIRQMGNWGALEEAAHSFYELRDGEWVMVGGARYMHVWQWMAEEGKFRLKESLSYDHDAAIPYPLPPNEE